jgi:CubicO group peptidase (beta-lactamase class C family)
MPRAQPRCIARSTIGRGVDLHRHCRFQPSTGRSGRPRSQRALRYVEHAGLQHRDQPQRRGSLRARLRLANIDLNVAITPASVFDAASVSKQFTAMSILLLAERRQLSLEDDVGKYISDWGPREHRVTIRHLLTHTSGLRDAFLLQALTPQRAEDISQQIVRILARTRGFNFVPGSQFEYNNGGYVLLARASSSV